MSLLHRTLLAQIMTAIDPVVEAAVTTFVPAAGVIVKDVLDEGEKLVAGTPAAAPAPAPAPDTATEKLSAADVINALTATLAQLQSQL